MSVFQLLYFILLHGNLGKLPVIVSQFLIVIVVSRLALSLQFVNWCLVLLVGDCGCLVSVHAILRFLLIALLLQTLLRLIAGAYALSIICVVELTQVLQLVWSQV